MSYFTIQELTATKTGLKNEPNAEQIKNLNLLIENVLDPARVKLGQVIKVTSGFRCEAVNQAVGGAKTSQHLKGEAADLICTDNRKLFFLIKDNLKFDQLIWEKGTKQAPAWVHVSFSAQNRNQILYL